MGLAKPCLVSPIAGKSPNGDDEQEYLAPRNRGARYGSPGAGLRGWDDASREGDVELLFCHYRNTTNRLRIVRCCGPEGVLLERVVFPFERLSFRCPPASEVQIWTHGSAGAELAESVPAEELHSPERGPDPAPAWWPPLPPRSIGVRDNGSAVCLEGP
jgi:hypothetical protein